jgi:hypothetical protein
MVFTDRGIMVPTIGAAALSSDQIFYWEIENP